MPKVCPKCRSQKSLSQFSKNKTTKDGFSVWCKSCHKQYQKENRDKLKDYSRIYYREHREKALGWWKDYYKKNKKSIIAKQTQRGREKYHSDIQFRLRKLLRVRFRDVLRGRLKQNSILDLLGCSIEELKCYLEKQFQPGMFWSNQGLWHIDHIIPLASFDLTKQEDLEKAFHFNNLQPLWANDNIRKGHSILKFT